MITTKQKAIVVGLSLLIVGLLVLDRFHAPRVTLNTSDAATATPESLISKSDLDLTGLDYYIVDSTGPGSEFIAGLTIRNVGGDKRFYTLGRRPSGTPPVLAEISISGKSPGDVVSATRSWANIFAGAALVPGFDGSFNRIYWDPLTSKLCTNWTVEYYSLDPTQLSCRTLNDNGTISNFKEISLQGLNSKHAFGGFVPVPSTFQSTYAVGPLATGFGGNTSMAAQGASMGPNLYFFPAMAGLSNGQEVPISNIKVGADTYCGTLGGSDWYGTSVRQCPERGRRLTQPNNYGDYASSGQPLTLSGTVNTNGTLVTWVSERYNRDFTTAVNVSWPTYGTCWWPGNHFVINNVSYVVASCTDATHIVLTTSAGTQAGVSFTSPSPFEPLMDQRNVFQPNDLPGHRFLSPAPDGYGRMTTVDGYGGACWFSKGSKTGLVMLALLGDGDIAYADATIGNTRTAWELHVYSQASIGSVINGTTPQEQLDWTNAINLTSYIPLGTNGKLMSFGYGISGSMACDYDTGDIWLLVNFGESYAYPASSRLVKIPCPACADPSYTPSPTPTPTPTPSPTPSPSPNPTPTPSPSPTPTSPSANCTKALAVMDALNHVWTFSSGWTMRDGQYSIPGGASQPGAQGTIYKIVNGVTHTLDPRFNSWYRWNESSMKWTSVGATEPACSVSSLVGDLNHDGIVNTIDWSLMNSKWFTSDANADLNHDGIVNSIDFSLLNNNWFKTTP